MVYGLIRTVYAVPRPRQVLASKAQTSPATAHLVALQQQAAARGFRSLLRFSILDENWHATKLAQTAKKGI